jgi:hypothetical protein
MSETAPTIMESQHAPLSAEVLRDKIDHLEALMRREPQVEIEPVHHFANGLYAREITIPAGTLLTGKIHRTEHLNVISKGRIVVWTEDGMKEVSAPFTMVSRPGTKRVGYALEDTVWITIHATTETDLVKLEAELIAPTRAALDEKKEAPCLG